MVKKNIQQSLNSSAARRGFQWVSVTRLTYPREVSIQSWVITFRFRDSSSKLLKQPGGSKINTVLLWGPWRFVKGVSHQTVLKRPITPTTCRKFNVAFQSLRFPQKHLAEHRDNVTLIVSITDPCESFYISRLHIEWTVSLYVFTSALLNQIHNS